ncbi:response regulator transcription factor [Desulfitibacter alkalitolerans]|uniref:response regulator transcription factor n=1 Tax=Desulfitibacter alkalitolerans TaxID=264641 RepID=UPI0004899616|nr:response regulator [Desulfitibacter alkalitolerans]
MYKLLIVEDEELERQVLKTQISSSQLPVKIVAEAASGNEAVMLFKTTKPEIILMDIKMPGMDGLEATKIIKELDNNIEIIFITAYSRFSYSNVALKLRAADYLLKPVRPNELIESIKNVIKFIEERKTEENINRSKNEPDNVETAEVLNDNLLIREIKNFICGNYQHRLTLNILADFVHYNPSYISSLFKKITGQGITEYITEVRIKKAKELLINKNISMDEVADEVGLNNNSYLTAIFKRKVGISPSEYRRKFSKLK